MRETSRGRRRHHAVRKAVGDMAPHSCMHACAQEPRQKILDVETAVQMLHIAMPPSEPHLRPFCEFLEAQSEYRAINLDQWTGFLRFTEEVRLR